MAANTKPKGSTDPNFPAHTRNYDGFIKLLKYSIIGVAIITAAVLYVISN